MDDAYTGQQPRMDDAEARSRPVGQGGLPHGLEDIASPITGRGAAAMPVVQLDGFSGALDWLLDLTRQNAIDLAAIPIRDLVDQFVAALEAARDHVPLERRADWLVTATWFVQLKSQLLLPDRAVVAEAEQRAEATRERLLEKARMQAAAAWLAGRRPQLGFDVFARGQPEIVRRARTGDIVGLLRACLWLLRRPLDPPPAIRRPVTLWRPPDAITHLEALLSARPDGGELLEFLPPHILVPADRAEMSDADWETDNHVVALRGAIASTLIAALELTRRGTAACDQYEVFGSVHVRAVTGAAEA
jgi:segregation and condensation protein A